MKKLSKDQIETSLVQLDGWSHEKGTICKTFRFHDFKEAFAVMTRIAFESEALNHHPNWENVYNSLTIRLNTHDANGITEKDFSLAKSIEEIVNGK